MSPIELSWTAKNMFNISISTSWFRVWKLIIDLTNSILDLPVYLSFSQTIQWFFLNMARGFFVDSIQKAQKLSPNNGSLFSATMETDTACCRRGSRSNQRLDVRGNSKWQSCCWFVCMPTNKHLSLNPAASKRLPAARWLWFTLWQASPPW